MYIYQYMNGASIVFAFSASAPGRAYRPGIGLAAAAGQQAGRLMQRPRAGGGGLYPSPAAAGRRGWPSGLRVITNIKNGGTWGCRLGASLGLRGEGAPGGRGEGGRVGGRLRLGLLQRGVGIVVRVHTWQPR